MSAAAESESGREARLAQNEVVFRSVNESIERQALVFGGTDAYEFVCECMQSACFERIRLTLGEYEGVRAEGTRFAIVPGHENPRIESVVETRETFAIVEKYGVAGVVAEAEDPRAD